MMCGRGFARLVCGHMVGVVRIGEDVHEALDRKVCLELYYTLRIWRVHRESCG